MTRSLVFSVPRAMASWSCLAGMFVLRFKMIPKIHLRYLLINFNLYLLSWRSTIFYLQVCKSFFLLLLFLVTITYCFSFLKYWRYWQKWKNLKVFFVEVEWQATPVKKKKKKIALCSAYCTSQKRWPVCLNHFPWFPDIFIVHSPKLGPPEYVRGGIRWGRGRKDQRKEGV